MGLQIGEMGAQAAMALRSRLRLAIPERQLLQHLGGGPTAVVAHPGQPQAAGQAGAGLPGQPLPFHRQRVAIGADRSGHQRQGFTAAAGTPAEQPVRERIGGVPEQFVGAEPTHPGRRGHGRQAGPESETVRQPGQGVAQLGEAAPAVGLTQLELAQQGGGADQHAVCLHPGAIDRLEPSRAHRLLQPVPQGGTVLLQPGIERGGGVGEMKLGKPLQQIEHGSEGALRRLPGVGHRPEPGEIEMGMAQHVEASAGRRQRRLARLLPQPHQLPAGGIQHPERIGRIEGLQFETAVDQGSVVVERAAQAQLQIQGVPLPPALRQSPATGRVEQITMVRRHIVDEELHLIGPPAQHQPGAQRCSRLLQGRPGGGAHQPQPQQPPLTAPRPDHQTTGVPVGPMGLAPGVREGAPAVPIRLNAAPQGLQIQAEHPGRGSGLRRERFKLVREPRGGGLGHRWIAGQVP